MKTEHLKKGFTLIELLVVIAVISILSALLMPNFMAVRERARDTQRKSDLKQLKTALELYKQNQSDSSFPSALPAGGECWSSTGSGSPCPDSVIYMKEVPSDPNRKDGSGNPEDYYYTQSTGTYSICTCLENGGDPEGVSGDCAVDYACSSGKKLVITPD